MRSWFRLFAVAVVLTVVGNVLFVTLYLHGSLADVPEVGRWNTSHFMFSYQDLGFVKRGLIGTLLDLDNDATSPAAVVLLASAAALAFAGLVAAAAVRVPARAARVFILLSPATFVQAGYDLGRFDTITYVLVLVILLHGSRWMVLLAPLTILVHEVALFSVLPLVVCVHAIRFGIGRELVLSWAASLGVLAATLLVGSYEGTTPLVEIYPNQAPLPLQVLTRGIADNVAFTLEKFPRVGEVFWTLFAAIALHYASILVYIGLAFGRTRVLLALAASVPPLFLMVIGTDWARWVALCTVNALLFYLFTADSAPGGAARERRLLERYRPVVLAVAVVSALGGPMGVNIPLPIVTRFIWSVLDDAQPASESLDRPAPSGRGEPGTVILPTPG